MSIIKRYSLDYKNSQYAKHLLRLIYSLYEKHKTKKIRKELNESLQSNSIHIKHSKTI